MMNRCIGCGVKMQVLDASKIGFTSSLDHKLCNRCFRIRHYNEYQKVPEKNYETILEKISETDDLVVLVVDLFLFPKDIWKICSSISNDVLLVLTKRDILPKKVNDQKWISYFADLPLSLVGIEVVSSFKNYHFDDLFSKINMYKKSKNVYVVGYTNAGKSTLINQIIYHYSNENVSLTTSMMPSTTLDFFSIAISSDLTLIDTPGFLVPNSFMNYIDAKILKKIMPKKELKPITYQVKAKQYIVIEDILCIGVQNANITLYFSNDLSMKRIYKRKIYPYQKEIFVSKGEDLVIEGLGFLTTTSDVTFFLDTLYDIAVYTRKKLI